MRDKFLEIVKSAVNKQMDVTMDTHLNELDSVEVLVVVMELESEFGISVPMEKFDENFKLGDLYGLVNGQGIQR